MVKPLTLSDIGDFLQMVFYAFSDFIYFSFVVMVTFAVVLGVRRVLYWGY